MKNIAEMRDEPEHQRAKKTKMNIEEEEEEELEEAAEDFIAKYSCSIAPVGPIYFSSDDDVEDGDVSSLDNNPLSGPIDDDSDDGYGDDTKLKLKLYGLIVPFTREQPIYPLTFIPDMLISDYLSSFDYHLALAKKVCFIGVIIDQHIESETTFIYELHDFVLKENAQLQVKVIAKAGNSCMEDAEFSRFHRSLKPGVLLGVSGLPEKSENGDPAICPSFCIVLTTEPKKELPDTYVTLEDTSSLECYRKIMSDKRVAPIFGLRYEIVNYISSFLQGHILFKGGTLNVVPGKLPANDRAVSFHSSPHFLKWHQMITCEHEYAYKLGQKINEGINLSHITELIKLDLCIDFQLSDLMALTESLLSEMVKDLIGKVYKIESHANGLDMDPIEIDFNPPFRRIDIMKELDKLENLEKPEDFSGDALNMYLTGACTKDDIKCPLGETNEKLLDKVVKHFSEKCVNPTFILYHPNIVSCQEKCGFTPHFKLFINKHEVFNGYVSSETRIAQIQRIWNIKDRPLTESEENALEYGLVKTGGWSLGIDQLTLLLTDAGCVK